MSGIFDLVTQSLGQGTVGQLSNELGTDQSTTARAVSAALPALFGGMAQHAQTGTGEEQINNAVTSTAMPPSAPEPNPQPTSTGGGLLSKILGPHQDQAQNQVAQASGLDMHQAGKVLMYLAPVVIGVLARRHQDQPQAAQQSGGGGLASVLQQAHQTAQSQTSSGGGLLGGLLGHILG